jgi:putative transposase
VQTVGRRYVSAYNRRHGQRGSPWDGRFRCGVVEAGAPRLAALRLVDGAVGMTSAPHRCGGERLPLLTELPEYWALGNTPFDREARYRTLLVQGLPADESAALREAALGGWASGSPDFVREAAAATSRPLQPRPRGRPRRA